MALEYFPGKVTDSSAAAINLVAKGSKYEFSPHPAKQASALWKPHRQKQVVFVHRSANLQNSPLTYNVKGNRKWPMAGQQVQ
jgi:hypothetical protein